MNEQMLRSLDLPDFAKPPVTEVVIGIQFQTPPGYRQIMAGRVYDLFSKNFPVVQEHPPLPPSYEIFGAQMGYFPGPMTITGIAGMTFQAVPIAPRYWFLVSKCVN